MAVREVDRVKADLLALPERIFEAREKCEELRERIGGVEEEMKALEHDIRWSIFSEVDAGGKPVFSNEEKRAIEFYRRTRSSEPYMALVEEAFRLRKELAKSEDELRLHQDRFKAALVLARLAALDADSEVNDGSEGKPEAV